MPATPASGANTYVRCSSLPVKIGTQVARIQSGGFRVTVDKDDMTHSAFKSRLNTFKTASGSMVIVLLSDEPLELDVDQPYALTINYNSATPPVGGNPSFKGTVWIELDGSAVLDVSKGVKYTVNWESEGTFEYKLG